MELISTRLLTPFLVSLTLSMTACGSGDSSISENTGGASPGTVSAAQSVANLENSGKIPKLDRGADLKGPDSDNNGIRDDIDTILISQNLDALKLKAAQQSARIYQAQITVNLSDKSAVQTLETKANSASKCLADKFGRDAPKMSENLEKMTANTTERVRAYLAYDKAQNGTVASIPEGDTCE